MNTVSRPRICLICEGSYPYIRGGVSAWAHTIFPGISGFDFGVYSVMPDDKLIRRPAYKLPDNASMDGTSLVSAALTDVGKPGPGLVKLSLETSVYDMIAGSCDIRDVTELARAYRGRTADILMSEPFMDAVLGRYYLTRQNRPFMEYLWAYRGIWAAPLYLLSQPTPKADAYHSVSAGYGGLLGAAWSADTGKPFLLSEHGVYIREREEDIIRARWLHDNLKSEWIGFFKIMARYAYGAAAAVTALFPRNAELQIGVGAPADKMVVIPNGTDISRFAPYRRKPRDLSRGDIALGAVLRVAPIKDVITLLLAFDIIRREEPRARLIIMGPTDEDKDYYEECLSILRELGTEGVEFTGSVDVPPMLGKLDILLLSSISEGQPFALIEAMAAGVPCVSTDVGDCAGVLYGDGDGYGKAGVIVRPTDYKAMARETVSLIRDYKRREAMSRAGISRAEAKYTLSACADAYSSLYSKIIRGEAL